MKTEEGRSIKRNSDSYDLTKSNIFNRHLSFILMMITSIILYIIPQGRVACWADWRMWGMTKTQWGDIHIVGDDQTLQTIAAGNRTTPKTLCESMKGDAKATTGPKGLPDTAPPGTGRLTLADICTTYDLDCQALTAALAGKNITATDAASLRDIASKHGMGQMDLYEVIKSVSTAK